MTERPPRPRVCVAIPHFYAYAEDSNYGSGRSRAQVRRAVLTRCLQNLHFMFGPNQAFVSGMHRCNAAASELRVVVCTSGERHLLDGVPPHLFVHRATDCDPRLLGYECHAVLAEHAGDFDFLGYLEDDLLVTDPETLIKVGWFAAQFGEDAALQPQRYEAGDVGAPLKLYIDGNLNPKYGGADFQALEDRPVLATESLGRRLAFIRMDNPHAGCFFLTAAQMRRWIAQPYFLDRSDAWVGPLESAATLGLMRAFRVYKPALGNASFLEIEHLDHRHLDRMALRP